jgi:alpha-glucosidase
MRHAVAATLLMTTPGTPMIFSGDEVGAQGEWGEDSRTCFPWDARAKWDERTFAAYRRLIELRRTLPALIDGGMRWLHVSDNALAWIRETADQRVLVVVARTEDEQVRLPLARLNVRTATPVFGIGPSITGGELVADLGAEGVCVCIVE